MLRSRNFYEAWATLLVPSTWLTFENFSNWIAITIRLKTIAR